MSTAVAMCSGTRYLGKPGQIYFPVSEFADVDTNHPMAGKTLTFDIEIIDVRAADADEIAHGPGGHH